MKWIAFIIGSLAILLTILPLLRYSTWLVRIGDFPRLQILVAAVFALFLLGFVFDFRNVYYYIFAAALAASIGYQIWLIFPFTRLHKREVQAARERTDPATNISLLIFNILMDNNDFGAVQRLVEKYNADIVLLAEPNQEWMDNLKGLEQKYPHIVACPLENKYGMILYSRLPLHDTELQFLIQDDIPSIHTQITLPSGDAIALHGVHPRPPAPGEGGRSLERDGELMLVGKALREANLPTIVAGDMNDSAWSYTTRLFKKISGLLDPRVGRGFFNSFHADIPLLRLPLDHVFHSHHFRLIYMERIKNACGSDHFPVFIALSLEESAEREQSPHVAEEEEKQEAVEKIEAAIEENTEGELREGEAEEIIEELTDQISRDETLNEPDN